MGTVIRWGILGTGWVAGRFAEALQSSPGSQLTAVGSRDIGRAQSFASRFPGTAAYGSYEHLAACDVDVIYVATPQHRHVADARIALNHRRHVVIEKPFALSSAGVREIEEHANTVGRLAVEALWTYFNPLIGELIARARDGRFGELRSFSANCGPFGISSTHRALQPELGGSFLWECLVYPISILTAIDPTFLEPSTLTAVGQSSNGVNASSAVLMTAGSAWAQVGGGVRPDSTGGAKSHMQLGFEQAWVELDDVYNPSLIRIGWVGGAIEELAVDAESVGFGWEIAAIATALGDPQSLPDYASVSRTRRNAALLERIARESRALEGGT